MDKTLRAFNLLMELQHKMQTSLTALKIREIQDSTELCELWKSRYRSSRWKAGILERYIQEKLGELHHD